MALTEDERKQLEALQAKESEPDADDDFDIEIWDENGAGAKVPYSKGRKWLARFGIDVEEPSSEDAGTTNGDAGKPTKTKPATREGTPQRYFGSKNK